MPTSALNVVRKEILRPFNVVEFATTTNITTNNSVLSTSLANEFPQDDYFNGQYIIIRGTNNARVQRRVTDYTGSTGTLTVSGATLAAESGTVTCEISWFSARVTERALNRARQDVHPAVSIVRDIRLVTGQRQTKYTIPSTLRELRAVYLGARDPAVSLAENLLSNAGFEDWAVSSAPDSWTVTGTGATATEETETTTPKNYAVMQDGSSTKFSVTTNLSTLLQSVTPSQATEGMEVNFSVWVYCKTASRVSAQISGTDVVSTPVNGSTHNGRGWELLTVSANIDEDGTSFSVGISVTADTALTCYVDEAICVVGQSEDTSREWMPLDGWRHVLPIEGASSGGTLEFNSVLPEKRQLRLIGTDMLSELTAETGTIEINGDKLEPYYAKTRQYLCEERANAGGDQFISADDYRKLELKYRNEYDEALNRGHGTSIRTRIPSPYGNE